MEEDMQQFWSITLYYFKKDKSSTEMQKKICAVYREGAMTDQTCQKWFVKFHAEDFSYWTTLQSWVDQLKLTAIKSDIY